MYIVCLLTVVVCGLVCLNYVCLPYIHNYFYYIYLSNYISYTYTGIRIQCTFRGGGRHILYISMLRIRTLVSLFQLRSRLGLYECLIDFIGQGSTFTNVGSVQPCSILSYLIVLTFAVGTVFLAGPYCEIRASSQAHHREGQHTSPTVQKY